MEPNSPNNSAADKPSPGADAEGDSSSVAIQQDVLTVQQPEDGQQSQPAQPSQANVPPSVGQASQPISNAANLQLLKEANSQYQYQINSRYEEKTRPVYGGAGGEPPAPVVQYLLQTYPYMPAGYPYYKENNQYQELGNGQRRTETNVAHNDGVRSQYENQDQSSYTHQRSQSYSEYGKGESSPEYNTYTYKRMYY